MERPKKTETDGLFGVRRKTRKEGLFSENMRERKLATTVEREARVEAFSRAELVEAVRISFLRELFATLVFLELRSRFTADLIFAIILHPTV